MRQHSCNIALNESNDITAIVCVGISEGVELTYLCENKQTRTAMENKNIMSVMTNARWKRFYAETFLRTPKSLRRTKAQINAIRSICKIYCTLYPEQEAWS